MYVEIDYDDGGRDSNPVQSKISEVKLVLNCLELVGCTTANTVRIFSDAGKLLHTVERRGNHEG